MAFAGVGPSAAAVPPVYRPLPLAQSPGYDAASATVGRGYLDYLLSQARTDRSLLVVRFEPEDHSLDFAPGVLWEDLSKLVEIGDRLVVLLDGTAGESPVAAALFATAEHRVAEDAVARRALTTLDETVVHLPWCDERCGTSLTETATGEGAARRLVTLGPQESDVVRRILPASSPAATPSSLVAPPGPSTAAGRPMGANPDASSGTGEQNDDSDLRYVLAALAVAAVAGGWLLWRVRGRVRRAFTGLVGAVRRWWSRPAGWFRRLTGRLRRTRPAAGDAPAEPGAMQHGLPPLGAARGRREHAAKAGAETRRPLDTASGPDPGQDVDPDLDPVRRAAVVPFLPVPPGLGPATGAGGPSPQWRVHSILGPVGYVEQGGIVIRAVWVGAGTAPRRGTAVTVDVGAASEMARVLGESADPAWGRNPR